MKPAVLKTNESKEYFFEEGCFILELSNSQDDPDVSVARARVEPGVRTKLHGLKKTVERYYILSGKGRVEIEGMPVRIVEPGDIVIIPAGFSQRIENIGDSDLLFLAICTPRFIPSNYLDLDH